MTTARIVCINTKSNSNFKAFDIPLALVTENDFKQPIFGSNYLRGMCKPLFNLLPGNIKYKIWFTGGIGTFVPTYMSFLESIKRNGFKGPEAKLFNSVVSGDFAKKAFIDPNDPSVIYLEQPNVSYTI